MRQIARFFPYPYLNLSVIGIIGPDNLRKVMEIPNCARRKVRRLSGSLLESRIPSATESAISARVDAGNPGSGETPTRLLPAFTWTRQRTRRCPANCFVTSSTIPKNAFTPVRISEE